MADETPSEKYTTWPATVRYDGVFDFDGMYQAIVDHLRRHNYWFYETLYKRKPWSPMGTELILKWRAERKLDEYYHYTIEFEWHFMDFHHVEVIREGKKVTLTKAYFWVNIRGTAAADWQALETKSGNAFTKQLGKFFRNHVVDREYLYEYIYPLFDEVQDLADMIKTFCNMEVTRTGKHG